MKITLGKWRVSRAGGKVVASGEGLEFWGSRLFDDRPLPMLSRLFGQPKAHINRYGTVKEQDGRLVVSGWEMGEWPRSRPIHRWRWKHHGYGIDAVRGLLGGYSAAELQEALMKASTQ